MGKSHVRMDRKLLGDIESVETQYRWKELGVYDFSEQWKSKDWSRRLDSVPKEQRSLHFLTIVGRSRDPSLTGSRRPPLCVRKESRCLSGVYKIHRDWCTCPSFRFRKSECKHMVEHKRRELIQSFITKAVGESGIAKEIVSYL